MSELSSCLIGHWVHSQEEDSDETNVYRRADFPFPPSRGRQAIELLEGHVAVFHGFGPTDRPEDVRGYWTFEEPECVRIKLPGRLDSSVLKVVHCESDRLEVRQV